MLQLGLKLPIEDPCPAHLRCCATGAVAAMGGVAQSCTLLFRSSSPQHPANPTELADLGLADGLLRFECGQQKLQRAIHFLVALDPGVVPADDQVVPG